MSTTNFSVDPVDGFIQYTQSTKPYHTKLVEIEVEVVADEVSQVGMVERWTYSISP
jgi:hypothetical protein